MFIKRSKIISSKINHRFRAIVLCSDAKQTGRWVGIKVSKEHTASNCMVPAKHQHPPDSSRGTVTHNTDTTNFNATLQFFKLLQYFFPPHSYRVIMTLAKFLIHQLMYK